MAVGSFTRSLDCIAVGGTAEIYFLNSSSGVRHLPTLASNFTVLSDGRSVIMTATFSPEISHCLSVSILPNKYSIHESPGSLTRLISFLSIVRKYLWPGNATFVTFGECTFSRRNYDVTKTLDTYTSGYHTQVQIHPLLYKN